MKPARYYDMHIHLHEFEDPEEALEANDTVLVAVSDDLESLTATVELAKSFGNVIACAGYHPWNFRGGGSLQEAYEVARAFYRLDLECIGEVGLDKKFVPAETWNAQVEVFKTFAGLARETDSYMTIHSPNAWRDALKIIVDLGVARAMFHWYTGPLDLIPVIAGNGYYISINPAVRIQEKHRRVAFQAPLEAMVFESDGPYNYRGLRLTPRMIPGSIKLVAELKGVPIGKVEEVARLNSQRLLF
ncbi:MAG: TatD family hydrolase [Desulfurococcales archaeon]|nr:TatD family hydrolase [Desulfurococcales archaeon]